MGAARGSPSSSTQMASTSFSPVTWTERCWSAASPRCTAAGTLLPLFWRPPMLDNGSPNFANHVWDAAARLGRSAPRIVDDILREVFPDTTDAAESEGAAKILRT